MVKNQIRDLIEMKDDLYYLLEAAANYHEDESDGAFFQILRDTVTNYAFENGINLDEHDMVNTFWSRYVVEHTIKK